MTKFVMCADERESSRPADVAVNVDKIVSINDKPDGRDRNYRMKYFEDRVNVVVEGGARYTYFIGGSGPNVVERAVELLGVELVDRR